MAFNVARFKSRVANQGFLRSHSYVVNLNPPVGDGNEIRLRTESVSLPGASFLTVDAYRPYASGKIYNIPYSYNPQDIAMVHTIDGNGDILKTFWSWINLIADISGSGKFAANYHNEYIADQMNIFVYNSQQEIVKVVNLYEVFPMTIDQMQMSWGSNDETAKINVNYRFSHYEVN